MNPAFMRKGNSFAKSIHTQITKYIFNFLILFVFITAVGGNMDTAMAAETTTSYKNGSIPLSDMKVSISSNNGVATFQLYQTRAAKEFYEQLPLTLDLENFRSAQWMFYPPKKLRVTSGEAYHDGKKGDLSYYAPWGDVFMLYKDFHAGDEMHRIGVNSSGLENIAKMSGKITIQKMDHDVTAEASVMRMKLLVDGNEIIFELNDSPAAKDLYAQFPMAITVENYGRNEKIFYPPKKLKAGDSPLVKSATTGTLAYYAPWGDVVMFYSQFGSAAGLYELGRAIQGGEHIKNLAGKIHIEK